ncbi:hypothetical protein GCK32_009286 [Trichostrongylus colubriformis]|uniref:Uncharacterized protein n=1 Tax=Trichostrongylus colubriformis TaxID=6319 RepID=A0AAN8ERW2_TRICO
MLNPAEFSRLSPPDEDVHAHLSIDMSTIGFACFFFPSLLLTAVALVHVNDIIEPWEGNNDTKTQFLIENMELLRNGSYYYNYRNPETGIIDSGVIES